MLRIDDWMDRKAIVLRVCAFLRTGYGVIFTNWATATEDACIFLSPLLYIFVKCMIVMKVKYMVPIRAFQTTRTAQLEDEHIFSITDEKHWSFSMQHIHGNGHNILGIKTMAEVHYFEDSFTVLLLM